MTAPVSRRLPDRRDARLVVAAAVAGNLIGALDVPVTATGSPCFAALEIPSYYPPNWAFGVVWPVLDALIGAAAHASRSSAPRRPPSRADGRAALLMVPYLAWICFATALNSGIRALN